MTARPVRDPVIEPRRWRMVAAVGGLGAAVAALVLGSAGSRSSDPATEIVVVSASPSRAATPAPPAIALSEASTAGPRERFAAETRNAPWAAERERMLAAGVETVPFLATYGALSIVCASTLCEMRGTIPPGLDAGNRDAYLQLLQGTEMRARMERAGLHLAAAEVRPAGEDFVIVWGA